MHELVIRCALTGETMAPLLICSKHLGSVRIGERDILLDSESGEQCEYCKGDAIIAKWEDSHPK